MHQVAESQEEIFDSSQMSNYCLLVRRKFDLAERLRRAAGDVAPKVIAARSGVKPDQISKIFSGSTKDPQWSTMVPIVRDGLGLSLDEFVGDSDVRANLSPYDADDDIRVMADALSLLSPRDKRRVADFVTWIADLASGAGHRDIVTEENNRPDGLTASERVTDIFARDDNANPTGGGKRSDRPGSKLGRGNADGDRGDDAATKGTKK